MLRSFSRCGEIRDPEAVEWSGANSTEGGSSNPSKDPWNLLDLCHFHAETRKQAFRHEFTVTHRGIMCFVLYVRVVWFRWAL